MHVAITPHVQTRLNVAEQNCTVYVYSHPPILTETAKGGKKKSGMPPCLLHIWMYIFVFKRMTLQTCLSLSEKVNAESSSHADGSCGCRGCTQQCGESASTAQESGSQVIIGTRLSDELQLLFA